MEWSLDAVEIRVLGSLIEKQIAAPEYHPLSLNAVVLACNQTTNRDPITTYDEGTVARALESLRVKSLIWSVRGARVPKYEQRFKEQSQLAPPEVAMMCVLMLRGPQTAGEIRARTGRLHEFASLEEVDQVLEALMKAEPPFVAKLPRLPGTKESRFVQRIGAEAPHTERQPVEPEALTPTAPSGDERATRLEQAIEGLRQELQELRQQFLELKRQFE